MWFICVSCSLNILKVPIPELASLRGKSYSYPNTIVGPNRNFTPTLGQGDQIEIEVVFQDINDTVTK